MSAHSLIAILLCFALTLASVHKYQNPTPKTEMNQMTIELTKAISSKLTMLTNDQIELLTNSFNPPKTRFTAKSGDDNNPFCHDPDCGMYVNIQTQNNPNNQLTNPFKQTNTHTHTHRNVTQLITSKGYPCEDHTVITADGNQKPPKHTLKISQLTYTQYAHRICS
jgi:hypothetical protein